MGAVDPAQATAAFLEAIAPGSGVERVTRLMWDQAGAVQVERRAPLVGADGKIHHIYPGRPARRPAGEPAPIAADGGP